MMYTFKGTVFEKRNNRSEGEQQKKPNSIPFGIFFSRPYRYLGDNVLHTGFEMVCRLLLSWTAFDHELDHSGDCMRERLHPFLHNFMFNKVRTSIHVQIFGVLAAPQWWEAGERGQPSKTAAEQEVYSGFFLTAGRK